MLTLLLPTFFLSLLCFSCLTILDTGVHVQLQAYFAAAKATVNKNPTIKLTRTDLGSNPGLCGEKPTISRAAFYTKLQLNPT